MRELVHDEMVKTKSDATSSKKSVFFIDIGLVRFYFAKLTDGLNRNYLKTIYISNFSIN